MIKLFLTLIFLPFHVTAQDWKQAELLLEESNRLTIAMVKLEKQTSDYIKYLDEVELYQHLERQEKSLKQVLEVSEECIDWEKKNKFLKRVCVDLRNERIERYSSRIEVLQKKIAKQEQDFGYSYIKKSIDWIKKEQP